MRTKYLEFLNFHFLHEFYADGKCSNLSVRASNSTQRFMQNLGMLFRAQGNVGKLFIPDSLNLQELKINSPEMVLEFEIHPEHPEFTNFSDFPLDFNGILNYSIDTSTMGNSNELTRTLESANTDQLTVGVSLALNKLETNPEKWPITYNVSFKSRAIPWKYFILNNNPLFQEIQLQLGGKDAGLFSGPSDTIINNNQKAQVFDSATNLISMHEHSTIDLSLKYTSSDNSTKEITLFEHLPNASTQLVSSMKNGKMEVYSAIYIYV